MQCDEKNAMQKTNHYNAIKKLQIYIYIIFKKHGNRMQCKSNKITIWY